jgi:hypothetical protein
MEPSSIAIDLMIADDPILVEIKNPMMKQLVVELIKTQLLIALMVTD